MDIFLSGAEKNDIFLVPGAVRCEALKDREEQDGRLGRWAFSIKLSAAFCCGK